MRTKTMPIAGISRGITKNIVRLLKRAAGSNDPIGIGGTVIRTAITTVASRYVTPQAKEGMHALAEGARHDIDRSRGESVVQHDAQERSIDVNSAVVLDETQPLEFVHE